MSIEKFVLDKETNVTLTITSYTYTCFTKAWYNTRKTIKMNFLGKQLGAGAFGVVYKADARGIINAEETTEVAVKMVKKTADNMYIKALASELKIMVHLGKHINIVNLLGACTKNVGKRKTMLLLHF